MSLVPDTLIDFTADTTRAIAQLHYGNTFARTPVGIDRVVFGTDFPYLRRDIALRCREDIEASPELTDSERTAVLGATAMTLIPRLVSLRS
jgi:Amidohydrolase